MCDRERLESGGSKGQGGGGGGREHQFQRRGGRIWQKHFVTGLLVTLQQQKTQTSGQDLLRNRWCDSVHRREWKGERGNGDEGGRRETVGIWE